MLMKFHPTPPAFQSGFRLAVGNTNSRISDQIRNRGREGLGAGPPDGEEALLESCGASLQLSLRELNLVIFYCARTWCVSSILNEN